MKSKEMSEIIGLKIIEFKIIHIKKIRGIIRIERKRILSKKILFLFLAIVMLFSLYSVIFALKSYEVPGLMGIAVTWQENLGHAKANLQGKQIDREVLYFMREQEEYIYVDETNLTELVAMNYDGRSIQALSDEEIDNFYSIRLSNIRTMLDESQFIHYSEEEKERFMEKAEQVSEIQFGYAEGWKRLNDGMDIFVPLLQILIFVILLPLWGIDPKNNMTELQRAAKYGKKYLNHARILTAFITGIFLYLTGIAVYFVIKIAPFGLEGWNQCIQANVKTFFSLYHITNLQQFLLNIMTGLIAQIFIISFVYLVAVIMEKMMTSAVVVVFFWILLLLFDQMYQWPVNHYFANFMPLRMTTFSHYYIGNEIYRIFSRSFSCMAWSATVSGLLSCVMLISAAGLEKNRAGEILPCSPRRLTP